MGYAKIVAGGADGRYTIELDFGDAYRTAALEQLNAANNKFLIDLSQVDVKIAEAHVNIDAATAQHAAAVAAYIEAAEQLRLTGTLPPGTPTLSTQAINIFAAQIRRLRLAADPLRRRRDAILFLLRKVQLDIVRWNSVVALSTRQAWCTTLTEDADVGSYVATCDIPGDSNLVLLAPDCRGPVLTDGYLRARAVMSPEQSFWTEAVLPGWQKFKPTYRWGTVTGINVEANTMTVSLFDQRSTAQQLSVNQASVLYDVPVTYMTCDAFAFEVDDRVVVEFQGQDWNTPVVVGFLDNPKPCDGWQLIMVNLIQNGVSGTPRYLITVFRSLMSEALMLAEMAQAGVIDVDFRIDRGEWITCVGDTFGPLNGRSWTNVLNSQGNPGSGLSITFVEPGHIPILGGGAFGSQPGSPAHLRVAFYLDSEWAPTAFAQPYFPADSVIEVRIRVDGSVFANVAVRSSFPPFAVDSGVLIPSGAVQLDYVRFDEDGT